MLDKLSLTDKECEYLAKGIAIGVGCGVFVGAIVGNVALTFSIGGVAGIIGSLFYSWHMKRRNKAKKSLNKVRFLFICYQFANQFLVY